MKLDNLPSLGATTPDAVVMRYKLKAGQTLKSVAKVEGLVRMEIAGEDLTIKTTMQIDSTSKITAVDQQGNASITDKITRMLMKITGPVELEFDTNKPSDDENLKPLLAMINVEIPSKVSPLGKISDVNLDSLREALQKAGGEAMAKEMESSIKKSTSNTFVGLSEAPIKAGETYKAGVIDQDKMKMNMSYKVLAVSKDKSKALLEPIVSLELVAGAFPGIEAKMKSQRCSGWLLFDIEKGLATAVDIRIHAVLDIEAMGQTGTMEMTIKTKATIAVE